MDSHRFEAASEISTNYRCDNCGILISQVKWKRCDLCEAFDLCRECGEIPYDKLPPVTLNKHQKMHPNTFLQGNEFQLVSIMDKLKKKAPAKDDPVNSHIVPYHLRANERHIHVLSLDGGGVRGYMPIKILTELITQKHLPEIKDFQVTNPEHRAAFHRKQSEFTRQFEYFVGTSTGGLIAFCLAIGYNILDLMDICSDAKKYFKRNRLGPWLYSKYDPSVIHEKIDRIINGIELPVTNLKYSSMVVYLPMIQN